MQKQLFSSFLEGLSVIKKKGQIHRFDPSVVIFVFEGKTFRLAREQKYRGVSALFPRSAFDTNRGIQQSADIVSTLRYKNQWEDWDNPSYSP